ncbi:MAG: LTA synthase family protein [Myxococcales bacterium]|nr:LTA synthase family protein [Myxococcales bacterium]
MSTISLLGFSLFTLRPTWPLLIAALTAIGFRLGAWQVRAAFERPDASLINAALGLTYDLALVVSLLLAARAVALMANGEQQRRWLSLPFVAAIWGALFIRSCDLAHCYLVQCHWTSEAFLYLQPSSAGALVHPAFVAPIALVGLAIAGVPTLLKKDQAPLLARKKTGVRVAALPALAALSLAVVPVFDGVRGPEDVFNQRLIPELNFALQARDWLHAAERKAQVQPLSAATRKRFVDAGLLWREKPTLPGYPFVRRGLGEPAFPYPKRPHLQSQPASDAATKKIDTRPNVVLGMVESLDAIFIHELSGHFKGVMPNLSRLAREHTTVRGFYNTATPTISGLIATLCSIHPPTHPKVIADGGEGDVLTAYTCLSDLLHHAGYRTVFVIGSRADMTRTRDFLELHGFDEIHDRENFVRMDPKLELGKWGAYDRDLLPYVRAQIERLEALRRKDGKPFMLLFMTIDTHEPSMAPPECELPAENIEDAPEDPAARKLLAAYHCTDKELGPMFTFLAEPKRAKETLWLLTGDHAAFRTTTSRPLFAGRRQGWSFAQLPLIMHDPRHALPKQVPTLAGTLDIAPTILHMLGQPIGLHSLTGLSMFGRRRNHPFLLGRMGGHVTYSRTPQASHEAARGTLERICADGTKLLSKGPQPLGACDVLRWMKWQDELWHASRLFPKTVYWGQTSD